MYRRPDSERPEIWSTGRQKPPFAPRAYLRVSLIFAREGMAGLLERCALSAQVFGAEVIAGQWSVPAERLGRTGRLLPRHSTVGRSVLIGAEMLEAASETVLPLGDRPTEADLRPRPTVTILRAQRSAGEEASPPAIPSAEEADLSEIRALLGGARRRRAAEPAPASASLDELAEEVAAPLPAALAARQPSASRPAMPQPAISQTATSQPIAPARPAPAPAASALQPTVDDADLQAIRAMMAAIDDTPEPAPEPEPAPARPAAALPRAAPPQPDHPPATMADAVSMPEADPPAARQAAPRWLVRPVGLVLGIGLLALALPYGATRAGIAHLMGEDLRRMT